MSAIPVRIILLFTLLFPATSTIGYTKEPYWVEYNVELSGLSDEQLSVIEKALEHLKSLAPKELMINKKVYKQLSRFSDLFGFSFSGKDVHHWFLSRIRSISYHNVRLAAINQNKGHFFLGDTFFTELNTLERLYLLIHEARHSDDNGYKHIKCPKGFKFISATQLHMNLEKELACDDNNKGAYAFQAAFLFELFAYGIFDPKEVGLLYNSSISRVIP